jgi:hypothetical protein
VRLALYQRGDHLSQQRQSSILPVALHHPSIFLTAFAPAILLIPLPHSKAVDLLPATCACWSRSTSRGSHSLEQPTGSAVEDVLQHTIAPFPVESLSADDCI